MPMFPMRFARMISTPGRSCSFRKVFPSKTTKAGNSSTIVILRKALCGLRQSPQLFNKLLNALLTNCGLQRCEQEACIYKYYDADSWILIGCETDDLIVTGTNEKKIAELQKVFKGKWSVAQWGDIHTFLGMRCQYNRSEGGLKLDVEQKTKDMLERFPELAKLPYKTVPLQPSQANKQLKVGDIKPLTVVDDYLIREYPKIIGTMIYIAITARPDIAYTVGKLSRDPEECISPTNSFETCSKISLVICETLCLFHSVTLASHRKSLSCSHN